jgi:hypothetical protein
VRKILLFLTAVALVVGYTTRPAAKQGEPCSECGPGDFWVRACSGGQDQIANQCALVGIDLDLDGVADIIIPLDPCAVPDDLVVINRSDPRDDSQNFPGLRPVDTIHDVIDTEIISMCLTGGGITLIAGNGLGQGGVLGQSPGAIAELGDPALAESFFDVFFEADLGGGMYVYNQIPHRVGATINCVPPQANYVKAGPPLPLFTSPIPGQGMHVANLVSAEHIVNLPCPSDIPTLTEWGLIIFGAVLLGFITWVFLKRRKVIGVRI